MLEIKNKQLLSGFGIYTLYTTFIFLYLCRVNQSMNSYTACLTIFDLP